MYFECHIQIQHAARTKMAVNAVKAVDMAKVVNVLARYANAPAAEKLVEKSPVGVAVQKHNWRLTQFLCKKFS